MSFTKQEQQDFSFLPRGVVVTRWDRKTLKASFSPEVAFYGEHYILSIPLPDRRLAQDLADSKALSIKKAMLEAAMPLVEGYDKAKE